MIKNLTIWGALLVACIVLFAFFITTTTQTGKQKSLTYSQEEIDKQPNRKKLLESLVYPGRVFTKIDDRGDLTRVYVTQKFIDLDFDSKKSFASVVLAYYAIKSNYPADRYIVVIHNSKSGKEIGSYANGSFSMK